MLVLLQVRGWHVQTPIGTSSPACMVRPRWSVGCWERGKTWGGQSFLCQDKGPGTHCQTITGQ